MKILFSPQVNDNRIYYKFEKEDIVDITINNITEVFDFSGLPDGKLELHDEETGEEILKTKLPINPIISAEKKNGVLYLELLNWIPSDASYSERFPEWVGANEYVPPKEEVKNENEGPVEESGTDSGGAGEAETGAEAQGDKKSKRR